MRSSRVPRIEMRPRIRSNWPAGMTAAEVPVMRIAPPNSASIPRPRRKIRPGALISRSRPIAPEPPESVCEARSPAASRVRRSAAVSPTWAISGIGGAAPSPASGHPQLRGAEVDLSAKAWGLRKRPGDGQVSPVRRALRKGLDRRGARRRALCRSRPACPDRPDRSFRPARYGPRRIRRRPHRGRAARR